MYNKQKDTYNKPGQAQQSHITKRQKRMCRKKQIIEVNREQNGEQRNNKNKHEKQTKRRKN